MKRLLTSIIFQVHIGWISKKIPSLQLMCRLKIHKTLQDSTEVDCLPLPCRLKSLISSLFTYSIKVLKILFIMKFKNYIHIILIHLGIIENNLEMLSLRICILRLDFTTALRPKKHSIVKKLIQMMSKAPFFLVYFLMFNTVILKEKIAVFLSYIIHFFLLHVDIMANLLLPHKCYHKK